MSVSPLSRGPRTITEGDVMLFAGLAIGHPDEDAAVNQWPVARVGLEEVIDWQGF